MGIRNFLFCGLVLFSTMGLAETKVILSCSEAFSGQLPHVRVLEDGANAYCDSRLQIISRKGARRNLHRKRSSGLSDIRYVDIDTSGNGFVLKGEKWAVLLPYPFKPRLRISRMQATLHCNKKPIKIKRRERCRRFNSRTGFTRPAQMPRAGETATRKCRSASSASISQSPKPWAARANLAPPRPKDLFAAGYAACFGSACEFAGKSMLKLSPTSIEVTCGVFHWSVGTRRGASAWKSHFK